MTLLITLALFIIWYFNNTIGIIGIALMIIYHYWIYFGSSKSSKSIIVNKKQQIVDFFKDEFHFAYISKHSLYYLYPGTSKLYAKNCNAILIGCFIIGIISLVQTSWLSLIFSILFLIMTWYISGKFIKPMTDYKQASIGKSRNDAFKSNLDSYLKFFSTKWKEL